MLDEWSKHKSTSRLLAENLFRDLAAPSSLVYLPVCWAPLLCSRTYTSLSRAYIFGRRIRRWCSSPLLAHAAQRANVRVASRPKCFKPHTCTAPAKYITSACFQNCTYIIRAVFIIDVYHPSIRTYAALREERKSFIRPYIRGRLKHALAGEAHECSR